MPDLSVRSTLPEKMDDPAAPAKDVKQALRELETINQWLGGYNVILDALSKVPAQKKTLTIMDIGCGGGDVLRAIAAWAKQRKLDVKLVGVDWNPLMTSYAEQQSKAYPNISFRTMSVWDDNLLWEQADITMNSLFCHHFDDTELVKLMERMYILSNRAVIINDIHRHWFAYHSIKWITSVFSRTYLVKYDAPLSVARSLKRDEWHTVLGKAGIKKYAINWKWAWRWQIIIEKV
jgi:SAM-dependent methyltransferase